MKKNRIVTLIALVLTLTFATALMAEAPTLKESKIKTSSVCGTCKKAIEKAVNKLSGIDKASLDVATKMLTVKYDTTKVTLAEIKKAVNRAGYDADDSKKDMRAYSKLPACCKSDDAHGQK